MCLFKYYPIGKKHTIVVKDFTCYGCGMTKIGETRIKVKSLGHLELHGCIHDVFKIVEKRFCPECKQKQGSIAFPCNDGEGYYFLAKEQKEPETVSTEEDNIREEIKEALSKIHFD